MLDQACSFRLSPRLSVREPPLRSKVARIMGNWTNSRNFSQVYRRYWKHVRTEGFVPIQRRRRAASEQLSDQPERSERSTARPDRIFPGAGIPWLTAIVKTSVELFSAKLCARGWRNRSALILRQDGSDGSQSAPKVPRQGAVRRESVPFVKDCKAALARLGHCLRARREAAICVIALP